MKINRTLSLVSSLAVTATICQAQTEQTASGSSTYRLPTVTVVSAVTNEDHSVSKTANAVTVLSGEQVRPGSITTTRELGTYLPNVTVLDANNDRTPKFSIRGLRENNFATGDPAVGFYVDDIPYTDLNSRGMALFDVEEIEFLRGPQGTLFGANGPGGVVNIVTRQPSAIWEGRGGFTYGNYDAQTYDAAARGPIVPEKLSLGVSGLYSRRDGFVDNLANGSSPDKKDTLGGRVQLRWTPAESLDFSLTLHGQKFNDGFVPTFYPTVDKGPFQVFRDYNGYVDTDTWGVALKGLYENESVRVTSVSSYRDWRQDLLQDFDFSPFPARLGFSNPELDQYSEELRIQSNNDEPFKWLGGFYFSHADSKTDSGSYELLPLTLSTVPAPFITGPTTTFRTLSQTDAKTYALFGQGSYDISEKLTALAGVRLTLDQREMDRSKNISSPSSTFGGFPAGPFSSTVGAYSVEDEFTDLSPKFGLSYKVCEYAETYASVSRGYQSGGFNSSNDSATGSRFSPLHSWHYEIGAKTKCLEDRLLANVSLFYADYDDYQVYRINNLDPSQAYIVNASDVASYGGEVDAALRVVENLELSGALGVTETEFKKFSDPVTGPNFNGNEVNFVPEFTANIAAQYRFPFHIVARVELQGLGDYYLDEGNSAKQSAFALVNARLGYEHKNFEAYIFGRNLFDKEYTNNALDLRNAFQPDLLVRQPGDPMTFGVALSAKF